VEGTWATVVRGEKALTVLLTWTPIAKKGASSWPTRKLARHGGIRRSRDACKNGYFRGFGERSLHQNPMYYRVAQVKKETRPIPQHNSGHQGKALRGRVSRRPEICKVTVLQQLIEIKKELGKKDQKSRACTCSSPTQGRCLMKVRGGARKKKFTRD